LNTDRLYNLSQKIKSLKIINKNNALYLLKAYSVRLNWKVFLAIFNTFCAETFATVITATLITRANISSTD